MTMKIKKEKVLHGLSSILTVQASKTEILINYNAATGNYGLMAKTLVLKIIFPQFNSI